MVEKLEMVTVVPEPPKGFWEVVGFEPYYYFGLKTTATFAIKSSAEKFAAQRGGEVRWRKADFLIHELS